MIVTSVLRFGINQLKQNTIMGKVNNTQQKVKTEYIRRMYAQKGELDKTENTLRDSIYNQLKELCKMYDKTIEFDNPIWVANWDDPEYPITITEVRGTTDDRVEVHYKNNNMELDDWDDFTQYATSDMSYVLDKAIEVVQGLWNVVLD